MAITVENGLLSLFQALAEVGEKFGKHALPVQSTPARQETELSAPPASAQESPQAEPVASPAPPAPGSDVPPPGESALTARIDALQEENARIIAQMAEQQQLLVQLIELQIKPKTKLGVVS